VKAFHHFAIQHGHLVDDRVSMFCPFGHLFWCLFPDSLSIWRLNRNAYCTVDCRPIYFDHSQWFLSQSICVPSYFARTIHAPLKSTCSSQSLLHQTPPSTTEVPLLDGFWMHGCKLFRRHVSAPCWGWTLEWLKQDQTHWPGKHRAECRDPPTHSPWRPSASHAQPWETSSLPSDLLPWRRRCGHAHRTGNVDRMTAMMALDCQSTHEFDNLAVKWLYRAFISGGDGGNSSSCCKTSANAASSPSSLKMQLVWQSESIPFSG